MSKTKTSCQGQFDFIDELEKNVDGDRTQVNKPRESIERCPHMKLHIFETPVEALVDTGSQVTCISEALYLKIKHGTSIKELSVSNVQIMSAVTKKCTAVDGVRVSYVFLIIPYLTSQMILGNNWLQDQKAVINYSENKIQLWGRDLSAGTISFGRTLSVGRPIHFNNGNSGIQTLRLITNDDLLNSNH